MLRLSNQKYIDLLEEFSKTKCVQWDFFKNKSILVTGSNGLIGRFLVDLIMYKNINSGLNCDVIALSRNLDSINSVFADYYKSKNFFVVCEDVTKPLKIDHDIDFVVHTASNSNPTQYSDDPIGTIKTNVFGTTNILDLCFKKSVSKLIFLSTFEIYGVVDNSKKSIKENDCGVIDSVALRSCYPESKRLSESLCVAYSKQKSINTTILRLSRVFGPTMKMNSTLSIASFIKCGLDKNDIVLKSSGQQLYSFNFVGDVITAILVSIINGKNGEAYNVSDEKFNAKLIDFASYVSKYTGVEILFEENKLDEKSIYSNTMMTVLDDTKIKGIGWCVNKSIDSRIKQTIDILRV